MTTIKPGIYADMKNDEEYQTSPALSASGAKLLLPPHVPADYKYAREHRETKAAYDFGHLAHRRVLGIGDEYEIVHKVGRDKVRVPADSMDTKSAQQHAAEIRAEGKVPVLQDWLAVVEEMAAAIAAHPEAHALLTSGEPEVSAFWHDDTHDIDRRCRYDVLPTVVEGRRMIVPDYKTARDVAPAIFNKRMADYGYDLQAATQLEGVAALLDQHDAAFVFVVQKNSPPYHVAVIEPDEDWLRIGRERMARACRIFAHCTATNHWPAYPGVHSVSPPPWVEAAHDALMEADETEEIPA